jgi:hypothetical protein
MEGLNPEVLRSGNRAVAQRAAGRCAVSAVVGQGINEHVGVDH